MRVLDLFSGIGGFSLGLEATGGFKTVAFCEIVPHAVRVLRKNWPGIPVLDDVTGITASDFPAGIDVVCGGFPCQDISLAGSGGGLAGARSSLWFEMLRIIAELLPSWAIIENVAALRARGLDTVLRGLAAIGYDAEWHCIPACAVGAPHRRDRIWIVAYPHGDAGGPRWPSHSGEGARRRDADRGGIGPDVADAVCVGSQGSKPFGSPAAVRRRFADAGGSDVADADKPRLEIQLGGKAGEKSAIERASSWSVEPGILRVAHGVPARVDRITRLGNAIVPQVAEVIGRAILSAAV